MALAGTLFGSLLAAAPVRDRAARERELATLRAEVSELEARVAVARERERNVEERLATLALELELANRRVAEATAARDVAAAKVAAAEAEIVRLTAALADSRAALRKRLVSLYRLGGQGELRLLLTARPGDDLGAAVRLLRFLARRDAGLVERYVSTRDQLEQERGRRDAERAEEDRWLAQEEERRRYVVAVVARQGELLASARQDRTLLSARAEALAAKERKLAGLLDLLYGEAAEPLDGRSITDFRGVLDWPVAGKITQPFGARADPRYRTLVPHRGVEISPDAAPDGGGAPAREVRLVRAVFPGKVVYAAPFESYGPTVVVHHPGRVFTLYAGLSKLLVAKGDVLQLGDPVGAAAGPLYFEIRRENRPEDPRGWFR